MPIRCYRLFAPGCLFGLSCLSAFSSLGIVAGTDTAFGGDQHSLLYPPEIRFRPVIAVDDPRLQRHYWDPRDAAFCPSPPVAWRQPGRYQASYELCPRWSR